MFVEVIRVTDTDNSRHNDVATSREDRARSLDSLHQVERLAGAAGPTRPNEWRDDLLLAIDSLSSSLHDQYERSAGEEGLLARLVLEAPHLASSVTGLRNTQGDLVDDLDGLRQSLTDLSRTVDVAAIREKLTELTARIRELRAWETDIVYEAYGFDLGTGD